MKVLDFIIEYSSFIIGVIVLVTVLFLRIFKLKKGAVSEWLLAAVTAAEKELGSGTGELKLRLVYEQFSKRYPIVSVLLPFSLFSVWVDEALIEMRKMLSNSNIQEA